jgi:hypothetical protein
MKTSKSTHARPGAQLGLWLGLALSSGAVLQAQVIQSVAQANGDTDRPAAQFTGNVVDIRNGGTLLRSGYRVPLFGARALCMTDRIHEWNAAATNVVIPPYLTGAPYVAIANNNRDNATLEVEIQLNTPSKVYLLVDNRIGDNDAANPPNFGSVMSWVTAGGWVATTNGINRAASSAVPDEVGYDENGDGSINQVASVYVKTVPAGAVKLLQQGESRNMYGVVVVPALVDAVASVNGDPEAERPTPKHTGEKFTLVNGASTVLADYWMPFFGPKAKAMTDRLHEWNAVSSTIPVPSYLVGNEYVAIANNYRDNPELSVEVSIVGKALAYLLVDNRIGDGNETTPPDFNANMLWVAEAGWLPVATGMNRAGIAENPDEVGYDENGDGTINQMGSVYYRIVEPGVLPLGPQNEGRNMYGLVVAPAVAPVAPRSVAVAKVGDGKVTLTWETGWAWSYAVSRSEKADGPFEVVAPKVGGGLFEDSGLTNGKTYYYAIRGENAVGQSAASSVVSAVPAASPANVTATGSETGIDVRWDAFPGASAYEVRRATVPGGPYSTVAADVAGTAYRDSNAPGGRSVYYVVLAQLSGSELSGASAEAVALSVPDAPVISGVETFSAQGVLVVWSSSNLVVDEFVVEQATAGGAFTQVASVGGRATRAAVGGLPAGGSGTFRVRARNASGTSMASATASGVAAPSGWFVNFANSSFTTGAAGYPLPGYGDDYGDVFGDREGGMTYGWLEDNTANSRHRQNDTSPDPRHDTLNHLQKDAGDMVWELAIPNGRYAVRIVAGDATAVDSVFQFSVEDVLTTTYTPSAAAVWGTFEVEARVADGLLTIRSGPAAANNKICFVTVQSLPDVAPTIGIEAGRVIFTGRLQAADSIQGLFQDVSGATSPYQMPSGGAQMFYRSVN